MVIYKYLRLQLIMSLYTFCEVVYLLGNISIRGDFASPKQSILKDIA